MPLRWLLPPFFIINTCHYWHYASHWISLLYVFSYTPYIDIGHCRYWLHYVITLLLPLTLATLSILVIDDADTLPLLPHWLTLATPLLLVVDMTAGHYATPWYWLVDISASWLIRLMAWLAVDKALLLTHMLLRLRHYYCWLHATLSLVI